MLIHFVLKKLLIDSMVPCSHWLANSYDESCIWVKTTSLRDFLDIPESLYYLFITIWYRYHYLCCRCLSFHYIIPLSVYTSDLVFPNFIQQKPPGAALQISSPWLLRGAGACPADIGRHRSGGRLSLDEEIGSALHDFTQMSVWG